MLQKWGPNNLNSTWIPLELSDDTCKPLTSHIHYKNQKDSKKTKDELSLLDKLVGYKDFFARSPMVYSDFQIDKMKDGAKNVEKS